MIKTFKKAISIFVLSIFVLSLLPVGALAEVEDEHYIDVPLSNFGGIRAGSADDGTSYYSRPAYKTSTDFAVMKHSTDGGRNLKYAVYQYDLSGVYKYLLDPNTTMNLVIREAGVAGGTTRYAYPYVVYAIPGDHEFSEFSMEYAVNAKLLNAWSGRYLPKYENMYAVASSGEAKHGAKTQVLDVVNISGVKSALDAGDSKMLTLFFQTSEAADTYLNGAHADNYIRINYNPETLDTAILDYYYNNFDWTDVSADSTGSVTSKTKLPSTFGDVNIAWEADQNNVIAEDGSIIEGKQENDVTLTATMSYGNAEPVSISFDVNILAEQPITVRVPFINYAYSRNSATNIDAKNHAYKYEVWENGTTHHILTGNIYRAYAQLDFSPYIEILKNPGTTISFKGQVGGQWSVTKFNDVKFVLAPNSADSYNGETITWNQAVKLGMHKDNGFADSQRPVLFAKSDGTTIAYRTIWPSEDEYPNGVPANKEALLQCLDESDTNGVVSVFFEPIRDESAIVPTAEKTGIYISYYESEIDDDTFFADIESSFDWDTITSDAQEAVVNNLPNYYKGADIVWSSGEGAVTSAGELVTSDGALIEDTITANVSYKGYSFTKEFNVTICDGKVSFGEPALLVENNSATANISVVNGTDKNVTYKLYLATYNDGELLKLVPFDFTINKGSEANKDLSAACASGNKAKFFVWENDGITPVLAATEK